MLSNFGYSLGYACCGTKTSSSIIDLIGLRQQIFVQLEIFLMLIFVLGSLFLCIHLYLCALLWVITSGCSDPFYYPMYMCKAINDKMFCYACSYLPLLKEETISSQDASFLPNEARKTLFKGKTFIFISKKQVIYIWIWLPKWSHFVFRFCCVFLWLLPPVGWQNHIKYVVKISERV